MASRFALLAVLAASTLVAASPSALEPESTTLNLDKRTCSGSNFWFGGLSLCLPELKTIKGCPSSWKSEEKSCPNNYSYDDHKDCCVPASSKAVTSTPTCTESGHKWDASANCCKKEKRSTTPSSKCSSSEFYFEALSCCIPTVKTPTACPPSWTGKGQSCPSNWSYNSGKGCCVPTSSQHISSNPSCSSGSKWSSSTKCCVRSVTPTPPSPTSTCAKGEFFWFGKNCCLPKGGSHNPPKPPTNKSCPASHEWSNSKGCCTPTQPDTPETPTCSQGSWNKKSFCCEHPSTPTPSGHSNSYKQNKHRRRIISDQSLHFL